MSCLFVGCVRPVQAVGLCCGHYKQRQLGKTLTALQPARNTRTLAERFWEKVDKRGPNECWPWTAHRSATGYGKISTGRTSSLAPRVAWELAHGPIPDGMHILHSCDNPPCVNPGHLRPGTTADNMADMSERGRNKQPRGERQGCAVLTDAEVVEIRRQHAKGGVSQDELSRRWGIAQSTLSAVVRRVTWAHVA